MNWGEFFSMGGRAEFVWGSFGAVALALAVEVIVLRLRFKRAKAASEASHVSRTMKT